MPPLDSSSHSALVVDEDLVSGWRVAEGLRGAGDAAIWGTSQAAAAAQLTTASYDVVLVSLTLPPDGALDIIRAIRAEPGDLVVLALVTEESEPQGVAALDAGADEVVARATTLPLLL